MKKNDIEKAVKIIENGEVIICPTDTVYGFLADAGNKKAVERIFKIKKRPRSKPLAVFVKDIKMAKELSEISKEQEKILRKHWPGKYTFVLKFQIPNYKFQINSKFKIQNSKLLTKKGTIALRIPKHKFLQGLLKKINKPLAQTSVNISGHPPLTKIKDIITLIKKCGTSGLPQILIINGGDLKKPKPSQVFDLTQKRLTRLR